MIVPAIIPQSLRDLRQQMAQVSFVSEIQIDVVDGVFAPIASWPYKGEVRHFDLEQPLAGMVVEVDIMAGNTFGAIKQWLEVGASKIVIHLEALTEGEWEEIKALKAGHSFMLAASINNDTPLQQLIDRLEEVDYVQLMGISEIGSQGQPFDDRVLDRIAQIKSIDSTKLVSIDGSVNTETLPRLVAAGADRFIVGSAIMKQSDPKQAFAELSELL